MRACNDPRVGPVVIVYALGQSMIFFVPIKYDASRHDEFWARDIRDFSLCLLTAICRP